MTTWVLDVRTAIIQKLQGFGEYWKVSYDANRLPVLAQDGGANVNVKPSSVECWDVSQAYDEARSYRRSLQDELLGWILIAHVAWPEEVVLEPLGQDLITDIIRVTPAGATRPVLVRLRDIQIEHPPREKHSRGTSAEIRFEAQLTRP